MKIIFAFCFNFAKWIKKVDHGQNILLYYATKDEYITITDNIIWHNYDEEELTDETKEVLEVYSSHINFLC